MHRVPEEEVNVVVYYIAGDLSGCQRVALIGTTVERLATRSQSKGLRWPKEAASGTEKTNIIGKSIVILP